MRVALLSPFLTFHSETHLVGGASEGKSLGYPTSSFSFVIKESTAGSHRAFGVVRNDNGFLVAMLFEWLEGWRRA